MPDILIYQTSDPKFAERAIKSLRKAGINCSQYGTGVTNLNANLRNWTDRQISIYIQSTHDLEKANKVLIEPGAAINKPLELPNHLIVLGVAALIALLVLVFK